MSANKLEKYLNSDLHLNVDSINLKHRVLLSTSKGKYLQNEISTFPTASNILWWCKSGARCYEQVEFARRQLPYLMRTQSKPVVLYVWLGTCDITEKKGKFIYLRHGESDDRVRSVLDSYNQIVALSRNFPSLDIVFLEQPPLSVYEWNKSRQHSDPDVFKETDKIVQGQIDEINNWIHEFNVTTGNRSPKFGCDLVTIRKSKGRPGRSSLNFSLYKDGVHPDTLLSKCWLRRLLESFN